jgi:hypothetical protein|nr:hypothetical protein [Prevotella sp.]
MTDTGIGNAKADGGDFRNLDLSMDLTVLRIIKMVSWDITG